MSRATHLLHELYPVVVEPINEQAVWITYVGPDVPANRRIGERRFATINDANGKPQLAPLGAS